MSTTRGVCLHALVFAAGLLTSSAAIPATESGSVDDSYTWSAELVSFDENAGTMTVRARIEPYAEIDNLASFSEGDRVTLVWTGRFWAAGVRDIVSDRGAAEGYLKLPVEFVQADDDGTHVSFRVPVPDDDASAVASVASGDQVRARSPREASRWRNGVTAAAPYNGSLD